MTLKKIYYYFFYKLYKSFENAPSKWLSDWKAAFVLVILEIWIVSSVFVYYKVFTKKDLIPSNLFLIMGIAVLIVLSLIKYFAFHHNNYWKEYVNEFDKLPKRKNKIGTFMVWLTILLILMNLVFSFYLMSQIDWKQYP